MRTTYRQRFLIGIGTNAIGVAIIVTNPPSWATLFAAFLVGTCSAMMFCDAMLGHAGRVVLMQRELIERLTAALTQQNQARAVPPDIIEIFERPRPPSVH